MRIFVTGASGWVGAAVVRELIGAGHEVIGLARSDAGATSVAALGAQVLRGSLEDLESLKNGAAQADGVIHTAFTHDFANFAENCAQDRRAILALGAALEGSDRPLLVTSGLARLAEGRRATEDDQPPATFIRQSEAAAQEVAARGVRVATVRLAPSVHGEGDHGFVPHLIALARSKGVSAYIGDGMNRWAGVHRFDAARLFRLALEQGAEGGPFHAVADEGVAFKQLAQIIGQGLGLPVESLPAEAASAHFGWIAPFVGLDMAATSARTRARMGWQPAHPALLDDLAAGHYFKPQP